MNPLLKRVGAEILLKMSEKLIRIHSSIISLHSASRLRRKLRFYHTGIFTFVFQADKVSISQFWLNRTGDRPRYDFILPNSPSRMTSQCHDQASRFVYVLTRGKSNTLAPEDFVPLVQDVVDTHPGLSFLKEATEFHSRYVHTVSK